MTTDALTRARDLLARDEPDEAERVLRDAAVDGDTEAARELGWLLSLDSAAFCQSLGDRTPWEAEQWLRQAAEARPDDCVATVLWAGFNAKMCELVRRSEDWPDEKSSGHVEFRERRRTAARARFRAQAGHWYGRALATDPACSAAASGLVAVLAEDWMWHRNHIPYSWREDRLRADDAAGRALLGELAAAAERAVAINPGDAVAVAGLAEAAWWRGDDETAGRWYRKLQTMDPGDQTAAKRAVAGQPDVADTAAREIGGFLLMRSETIASHGGDTMTEVLVVSDPAALRRGLRGMTGMDEEAPHDHDELRVYQGGQLVETIQSESDDDVPGWFSARIPAIAGPRLPIGHPVRVDGETYHHGYTMIPPW